MKKYLALTREGFTLVELMIVVAIIGILATIAVPQYSKFVAKSRQTEAKIALGGAYTAEVSFQTENNSYSGCLGNIGYSRDGTKFYYTAGFFTGAAAATACGPNAGAQTLCTFYQWDGAGVGVATAKCVPGASSDFFAANIADGGVAANVPTQAKLLATNTVGTSTFILGAVGWINNKTNKLDTWTMDNTKLLSNAISGI